MSGRQATGGRRITPVEIRIRLQDLPFRHKLAVASSLIAEIGESFQAETIDALIEALSSAPEAQENHAEEEVTPPHSYRDWASQLAVSPASTYLQARTLSAAGQLQESAERWAQFFALVPCRDPFLWLQSARVLADLKRFAEAAAQVREALFYRPAYSFYPRAARLISRIAQHATTAARRARIAVLGSSTTSLMIPVMRALCFRDRINAEFYEGMYGAFRQEILDSESKLYRFQPNIVFIINDFRSLNLSAVNDDEAATVARVVEEYKTLWQSLYEHSGGGHIVQHSFDFPSQDAYGYLADSLAGGRRRIMRLLNLELMSAAPEYVSVLDTESIASEVGVDKWTDAALWHIAKQHPSPEALPALAELQLAHVRATLGLTRKVVVCDLDNTLWGGVIGEDGLQGIQIGSGSPQGEAYLELHRYLLELKSRGVLLAVCSKNNPEDARLPFEQHQGMLLRLSDFAAFRANWNDKAENLKQIAETLALGTDSFVFLDDNPFERSWVRSQMPEVAVVELGRTPFTYVRDLDRGRYFYSLTLSAEDKTRADLYEREATREQRRESAGSLEEFLEGLHMRAACSEVNESNIVRITQLVNKTNQFNLTTRRYTQGQIEQLAARQDAWTGVFQLTDCFGDHGIIGTIFCVPTDNSNNGEKEWEIETWLMSCRVLGRQMENFMLDRAVEAARRAKVNRLIGVYRPTAKSVLVKDLYPRFGFNESSTSFEETRYSLLISEAAAAYDHFIDNVSLVTV